MTIYSFHLFDRNCDPQITHHFHAPSHELPALDLSKLLFGTIHSLRHTIRQLTPAAGSAAAAAAAAGEDEGVFSFSTSGYALHTLESPSLLRFTLLTSPDLKAHVAHHVLRQIYASLYVEYIVKNPLSLACLYGPHRVSQLQVARFGPVQGATKAQRRRRDEVLRRENEGDGGQPGCGVGKDVAMVMGCELFILALEQFVQQLPGYD
ncbi:Transport protein particle subunit bet5 [Taphrina deformans PYCC 5710]|uniref:Trafficking protein particle complex subunit n=1 Tax=Taphrina deformans (strain PYCC 5710 / ATCC 11124 / CBS 356.35 / IMI 108563 / JCM 9778 / NBRC 8474) TaxID=1097556 RepID=R4X778_TAPDE|nr:Transport protein particle subunit bet5 [Taphrina deformans PYCC 5710]|eukprot:CCG81162.1 Transport protein particle subunit bet5 [Taphrina deformans PYCC 5710]